MKKLKKLHYWLLLSPLIGLIILALGFMFEGYYEDLLNFYILLFPFLLPSLILFIILISVKKQFTDYFAIGGIIPTILMSIWMGLIIPGDISSTAILGVLAIPIIGIPAMPFGILFGYWLYRLDKKDKQKRLKK